MRTELYILLDIIRERAGCDFVGFRCRARAVADPKFKFAYVARRQLDATWKEISDAVGWKVHSTAIHAVRQVEGFVTVYPEWLREIAEIEDELEFRLAAGLLAQAND